MSTHTKKHVSRAIRFMSGPTAANTEPNQPTPVQKTNVTIYKSIVLQSATNSDVFTAEHILQN